ncbi:MAG: hypothetical protein L0G49_13615 [Luteococcus sp.]|uniref:hypothetical protein n=1 Tax=Luteococcus sp. TaxID=1969402 RepID=UPI002649A47A|nr:hypothetical protein [Luteococcus sp.]MDN5564779.1 hypothetical protein [Luteococcus sp.]
MTDALHIRVEPHLIQGSGDLLLRVSPELTDELLAALQAGGYEHSLAAEFSSGVVDTLIHVGGVVGGVVGGLKGLEAIIVTIIKRHDGTKVSFEVGGIKASAEGGPLHELEEAVTRLIDKGREVQELSNEDSPKELDD